MMYTTPHHVPRARLAGARPITGCRRLSVAALIAAGWLWGCGGGTDPVLPTCLAASVKLNPSAASTLVGGSASFSAVVRFGNFVGSRVCFPPDPAHVVLGWTSSDPSIAALQNADFNQSTFVAIAPGVVTITGSYGAHSDVATLTVNRPPAARITVNAPDSVLIVGASMTLTAEVRDQSGAVTTAYPVTWQSSDVALATVVGANASAAVTGVAKGNVTITGTAGGVSGSIAIRIADPPPIPVNRLKIVGPSTVDAGLTITLNGIAEDANGNPLAGRQILWSSSAPSVATVSPSGQQVTVTGVAPGQTTVTATSEGKSATHGVTVTLVPVASVRVTPASSTIRQGKFVQLTATALDRFGNVVSGHPIAWRSTNGAAATVSNNGLVTGVGTGLTTDIVATIAGIDGTGQVTSLAPRLAYGVANQPQAATQTAVTAYNSTGGPITITRLTTGQYRVNFFSQQRLPLETETLLVTPHGPSNTYCKLLAWAPGTLNEMVADVWCFAFGAVLADAPFGIMLIGDGALGGRLTFGFADQETNPGPYDAANSFNSASGATHLPVRARRVAMGQYLVSFTGNGGGASDAEAVHVTALGPSGTRCNLGAPLNGDGIPVNCWAAAGAGTSGGPPIDSKFTISLLNRGRAGERFGAAFVADAAFNDIEAGSLSLPATHVWSTTGNGATVQHLGSPGRYDIVFPGLASGGLTLGVQLVNKDEDDAHYCSVLGWSAQSSDLRVSVQCWNSEDGTEDDESFYIVVMR